MEDTIENYVYNENFLNITKIGNLTIGIDIPPIIVINLTHRIDRREGIIQELAKWQLPFSFYNAELHIDPVRGCLESHINVVKWAKENEYKNVCIFEDDVVIQETLCNVPINLVHNYDMLYLGGLCTYIEENIYDFPNNGGVSPLLQFVKGHVYCDHAYIIKNTVFDEIIEKGWEYEQELDRFYTGVIHTKYNAYLTYKQYVLQCEGWSEIDRKIKWENYKWPKPGEQFLIP